MNNNICSNCGYNYYDDQPDYDDHPDYDDEKTPICKGCNRLLLWKKKEELIQC